MTALVGQAVCSSCDGTGVGAYRGQLCEACGGTALERRDWPPVPAPPPPPACEAAGFGIDGPDVLVSAGPPDLEGAWPAGIWIERDLERQQYVLVEVARPFSAMGPEVRRRWYERIEVAKSNGKRRHVLWAWVKEGSRLIGYRRHDWKEPHRG